MDLEIKEYGTTLQECLEEGLPDKNGIYYFVGIIRRVIYSNPSFYDPNEYFNICEFETETPLPKLNLNVW